MQRIALVLLLALLGQACAAAETPILFLVRHADKASGGEDPVLSAAGEKRADALSQVLAEAGITRIFVTKWKRTQMTAAPLAQKSGVVPEAVDDLATLTDQLKRATGNTLVVGHSNTIPALLHALGIEEPVRMSDDQYDQLFVVTLSPFPRLIRLHYGTEIRP